MLFKNLILTLKKVHKIKLFCNKKLTISKVKFLYNKIN
ncbi:hypothetical protein CPC_1744 [Clostridium perfringens C str. JGS1495]|nr:hypothetical protein CPC_1744 [Clostridium perfringens C str. JGS1495]